MAPKQREGGWLLQRSALLFLLLALLPLAQCGAPVMWLQPLVDIDPLALCNGVQCSALRAGPVSRTAHSNPDGSPAGYYFVPGTTQSDVYLVYLEGAQELRAWGSTLR